MLKGVSESVSKTLCILINGSFNEGIFPNIWNVCILIKEINLSPLIIYQLHSLAILKKQKQEQIVFKNMYHFLIDNNLLYKYQSGFLPHHSTAFQLIDTFHNIKWLLMIVCFLLLCSAMCQNWHKCLLFKLRQNDTDGKLIEWLSQYKSTKWP